MPSTERKRVVELDVLRAVAIVAVVACHSIGYTPWRWLDPLKAPLTYGGLGLFVFVSGYALALAAPSISSLGDLGRFFSRRFLRIYPLYLPALAGFFLMFHHYRIWHPQDWSPVVPNFLGQALGLQVLLWPHVQPILTLWFIGLVILLYIAFLVLAVLRRWPLVAVLASVAIFALFVWLRRSFGIVEYRFFLYYWPFVVGAFCGWGAALSRLPGRWFTALPVAMAGAALAALSHATEIQTELSLRTADLSTADTILAWAMPVGFVAGVTTGMAALAHWLAPCLGRIIALPARWFSDHAYAIYLFHRLVFAGTCAVAAHVWGVGSDNVLIAFLAAGIPLVLIVAHVLVAIERGLFRLTGARPPGSLPAVAGAKAWTSAVDAPMMCGDPAGGADPYPPWLWASDDPQRSTCRMGIRLSAPDISQADVEAVVEVLKTPNLSLGPKLPEFEEKFAQYIGRRHAVAVNSGTSALHLSVKALGIGPGDEVITTPFSFVASANCVLFENARPVFVDIEPETCNIDVERIEAAITPQTKAILPVDVFGRPARLDAIEEIAGRHDLKVIEDSCEALGSTYQGRMAGAFGDCGHFAFYPNKQITTGEGGLIVTDDADLAATARSLRNQGRGEGGGWLAHERVGYNYRLSDINCALGITQLERLPEFIEKRAAVAARYGELLADVPQVIAPPAYEGGTMSWFVYVIRLSDAFTREDRDAVITGLRDRDIGCSNYFTPIHLQPFYRELLGTAEGDFPITERVAERTIALPFHNNVTPQEQATVVAALREIFDSLKG